MHYVLPLSIFCAAEVKLEVALARSNIDVNEAVARATTRTPA